MALMAKKKQGGKVRQHHQRAGKRLGLKVSGGENVIKGNILIRQRGTKVKAGKNVKVGRDHTLFAMTEGTVRFLKRQGESIVSVE